MNLEEKMRKKMIGIGALAVLIVGLLVYLFVVRNGSVKKEVVEATPTPTAIATATPEATLEPTPTPITVDVDSDDSLQRVANRNRLISETYVPADLRVVNVHSSKNVELREEAAASLETMFADAINENIYIKLVDGYRSYQEQKDLYNYYISRSGQWFADSIDAYPGASEHQLGLCADLGNYYGHCELQACFAPYPVSVWLEENAYKYGWVERFTEEKTDVTGIRYSPWHYRYIGVEEATKVHDSGLTLEEYYGLQ